MLEPGGTFGLELVADLPSWEEYRKRVSLKGWRRGAAARTSRWSRPCARIRAGASRSSTRSSPSGAGGTAAMHRFALTFRTLSVPQMARRLEKAGFEITALLGDYAAAPWDAGPRSG